MEVQIVVDRQNGVDRLAVRAGVGLDGGVSQLAQGAVDVDVMRCTVILDNRGDGGVLLGAQVLDLSVGKIIGAVGQLLDVQDVVADINVADRGGRQFKLGVDGLVCFQNRCEVILLGEFGIDIPADERVLVLGWVSGSCNCIAVADRDRVDGGAAHGVERQGMEVQIVVDIELQDRRRIIHGNNAGDNALDAVVGIVRAVSVGIRGDRDRRIKYAGGGRVYFLFHIRAVGLLQEVVDLVAVGVGRIGERENLVVFIKDHRLAGCVRRVADHVCGLLGHFGVERLIGHDLFRRENLIVAFTQVFDRVAHVGLCRVAPVELPLLGYGQSVQLVTGGADILFGFIPAVEVITGLFAGRQDACAGFKLADIERSAFDLVVVLIEVVEMDRPVPVCRDNAVASRASGDLGDLLAVLVVPLKERLAPVSTGRIGQRDGIALNRVRRGVGAGGLAVVVYILNGVLNGRKFAVELPFLGHVQLFDLSFYANISCFLIPAAEFVTIFCIRSPQAVGGIVNRVNRVHLLFYPRTGFIREVVLDCERLLLPLCGEFHAARGDGVGVASLEERFIGRIVCAVSVKVVGIIFSRDDRNAPALEDITFAGRVSGQGEGVAGEIEVVNLKDVVVGVVDSGHARNVFAVGLEHHCREVQVTGQLVAVLIVRRVASFGHVVAVVRFEQICPCDLLSHFFGNAGFEHDVIRQFCNDRVKLFIAVVRHEVITHQRQLVEAERTDGDVVVGVVAAEAETRQRCVIQFDELAELYTRQRSERAVQSCECVDVVRGDGVLEQNIRPAVDRIVRAERPLGAVLLVPVGIAVFGRVERIASDIEIEAEAVQELNNVGAIGRSRGVELRKIRLAFKGLEDHDILFGLDIDLDIVRSLTGLMLAKGRADGVRLVILKDHSGVGSGSLLDLLRLLHCFCLDGVEIDVFTIKSGNFIGIEILVLIVSRFAVHIQLGNDLVGLLFPLRNIGHSLRDRCRNFGIPACEGVAGAGRGAVERGGRGILPKVKIDLIGENFFVLNAVGVGDGVYLRHRYAALLLDLPAVPGPDQRDRNDLLIVLDMFQVLERRVELGHIAFGVIADVAKPVVPVLPRLADEVVFIALAEQTVGFRMLLRIIYDALDLNSHFKLFQLVSRRGFGLADDFNDRQFTLLPPFHGLGTSCFGVIAEGDGQRCVLLVNEPVLGAGDGVICHQIRRYRDRRGDVVALLVRLHIADRILRRGGNIIRLVSMCCFVVLADDSKTAVQRRGLLGLHRRLGALDFNVSRDAVGAINQVPRAILPPPVDAGFLVWLRIGVGSADLLIELRNVFRSVQSDGIDVSIFRPIPTEVIV